MSSKEFLKDLVTAGKLLSGGGGQGIVSRVKIQFGFHQYVSGHDFWSFWKPANSESELAGVKDELVGRLQKAGCNSTPAFGVKVTIDKNVLSRDEPYKANLQEFTPSWQEDAFNMIMDHIETGKLSVGEWFYGRVEYKGNPFFVKKGEAGKTDQDQDGNPRFPSIRIPTEKFTDEAAARGAVSDSSIANSQWSEKAIANYGPDMSNLENQSDDIAKWLEEAKKGNAFNNDTENYPLPEPPKPPTPANMEKHHIALSEYIAKIWDIEAADIDVLIPVPF